MIRNASPSRVFGSGEAFAGCGGIAIRPSQVACHAALRASGALVIVPRSVEELAQALINLGIEHPVLNQMIRAEGVRK